MAEKMDNNEKQGDNQPVDDKVREARESLKTLIETLSAEIYKDIMAALPITSIMTSTDLGSKIQDILSSFPEATKNKIEDLMRSDMMASKTLGTDINWAVCYEILPEETKAKIKLLKTLELVYRTYKL